MSETAVVMPPKFTLGQKVRCIRSNGNFLEYGKIYEIDMLVLCAITRQGKESGLLVHRCDTMHQTAAPIVWDADRFEPLPETTRSTVVVP